MRVVLGLLALLLGLWLPLANADDRAPPTVGQVKRDLIRQLEQDGYLSTKLSAEAQEKYVTQAELLVPTAASAAGADPREPSFAERYVSWTNVFKVLGVTALLIAFGGFLKTAALILVSVIGEVPKEVYQAIFLGLGLLMTLCPKMLWASQAFYLALFGAFANVLVLSWVLFTNPRLKHALIAMFNVGVPIPSLVSLCGMAYFGGLALMYQSEIFGFAAAVCLSGVLSFAMHYRPGILTLGFHDKGTPAVVLGHLAVLTAYCVAKATGHLPVQAALFSVGLEYYCTIAMGVGFLVGASPFNFRQAMATGGYLLLFVLVAFAAIAGYHFLGLKVVGSIVCVFGVLLALEWVGYLSYKTGFGMGTATLGAVLYGASVLLEKYGHFIVLKLA